MALLSACALPAGGNPGEGGMGLPQQIEGETYPGAREAIHAEVVVADNGCTYLRVDDAELLAIWPRGSRLSDPVGLPDGTELTEGDSVVGVGTIVASEVLPGGRDGYWAHVTGFCPGDLPRVVVLDEVSERR